MPPYTGHQDDGNQLKTQHQPSSSSARVSGSSAVTRRKRPSIPSESLSAIQQRNLSSSEADSAAPTYPLPIVWKNVFLFVILHSSLLYSLYAIIFEWPIATIMFATAVGMTSGLGVTVGAHRLWSHRSYKAKLPLRIFLMIMQSTAGQNDIYEWCRDHRVHHKFSETDADPHNARRGFFFSHMGWLMVRKHPDVFSKGSTVPMSDLLEDPVVRFQKRFYYPLATSFCIIIPTLIPYYFWSENFMTSLMMAGLARYCVSLHITWLVNSAAHLWGNKPYDENIGARQNPYVSFGSMGEGWHNFHHAFPYDYATSEYGYKLNLSKVFIDSMAWIGQAYDLKQAGSEVVMHRRMRTGDLSGDSRLETMSADDRLDASEDQDAKDDLMREEMLPSTSL